jgi:thiosulfate dehydrogenase [quinone] large subunit
MYKNNCNYNRTQLVALILLRLVIGWHFMFEGLAKCLNPKWSALGYLMDAKGFLSGFYYYLGNTPEVLTIINQLNKYGLTIIGFCLIVGLISRWASFGAIGFLVLYYFSHIPFIGAEFALPTEGNYLWIDKNMIEIFALIVIIYLPTSHIIGIDRFFNKEKTNL